MTREAVVVGAGPNGLVAAVLLAGSGWSVRVLEAASRAGGGTRTEELITPGIRHDVCAAVHPLGLASPALRALPLREHGVEWLHAEIPLAHPLDDEPAACLHRSVSATAAGLGSDGGAYTRLIEPFVRDGGVLADALLAPTTIAPRHPFVMARFGRSGILSAARVARRFRAAPARALVAGLGAHSMLPLDEPATGGFALLLGILAHVVGWPVARGGSQSIADALVAILEERGGGLEVGNRVASVAGLDAHAVLLDLTPRQVLAIAPDRFTDRYRRRLARYRYGPGVCKVDWVLSGPVPWRDPACGRAGTVHVGGTLEEIAAAEAQVHRGGHPDHPFVIVAQPSVVDPTRAPSDRHVLWGYCHVPHGSEVDMTERIEAQIERFAPGFRAGIVGRHTMTTAAMERHDSNYVGGDINGGLADLRQLLARPVPGLHPWVTPDPGIFLCSSATPPGGGVHGMCGAHAAREVHRRRG